MILEEGNGQTRSERKDCTDRNSDSQMERREEEGTIDTPHLILASFGRHRGNGRVIVAKENMRAIEE